MDVLGEVVVYGRGCVARYQSLACSDLRSQRAVAGSKRLTAGSVLLTAVSGGAQCVHYRAHVGRGDVRGFGHLKHEWGMLPLRVRRLVRVRLHVDLTILAELASALTAARTLPLVA